MRGRPRARCLRLSRLSLRRWPLWLVAAALLVGALPLHSELEAHGALEGPTQVWLEHCPPGSARHLESSTSVELPRCVVCLQQLQGKGTLFAAPQELDGLALAGAANERPQGTPASVALPQPASRGPPRA